MLVYKSARLQTAKLKLPSDDFAYNTLYGATRVLFIIHICAEIRLGE